MASSWLLSLFLFFSLSSSSISSTSTEPTTTTTITIPLTEFTKNTEPSSDPWQTVKHLASASLSRVHHLKHPHTKSLLKTPLYPRGYGGYSVSLSFGTPPQKLTFVMDTGSSLVWFPCTQRYTCSNCTFPNVDPKKIPAFIPKKSSSARIVGCANPKCGLVYGPDVQSRCPNCKPASGNCNETCPAYLIQYGLGATAGLLLLDNLDFPEKIVPDFLAGCSLFSSRQPAGIAGFGRSPTSLPAQMGLGKFSYCLLSRSFDDTQESSDLVLYSGSDSGDVKSSGVSYTGFLNNPNTSNPAYLEYYYVNLRKIIVGDKHVKIPYKFLVPGSDGNGGTIVDSGTTFTFMDKAVFEAVAREFETQMGNYTRAADVEIRSGLGPCYDVSREKSVAFPELAFQFKGGAKMELPLANYFVLVDEKGVVCMAILSGDSLGTESVPNGPSIILGSFQQQNYYIEYDLQNDRLGFRKQNCK